MLSLQFLNKSRRSSVEIWSDIVVPDCLQLVSTCCMLRSLDTVVMLILPARIWSANSESAAQLSLRRVPVVKGVPAHWLKCRWFRSSMAFSRVIRSYNVSVVPLVLVRSTNVTPGFGGLRIHLSLR